MFASGNRPYKPMAEQQPMPRPQMAQPVPMKGPIQPGPLRPPMAAPGIQPINGNAASPAEEAIFRERQAQMSAPAKSWGPATFPAMSPAPPAGIQPLGGDPAMAAQGMQDAMAKQGLQQAMAKQSIAQQLGSRPPMENYGPPSRFMPRGPGRY